MVVYNDEFKGQSGCAYCGYDWEIKQKRKCQICGEMVLYLKCSNPEKAHHVSFNLGYPSVQEKHWHEEWCLKSWCGTPLMEAVKESRVNDAEEILAFVVSVNPEALKSVLNFKGKYGQTILSYVYAFNDPEMVRLFERYC